MIYILLFVLVAIVVAVAAALMRRSKATPIGAEPWPLFSKKALSNVEQMLYQRLIRAYPNQVVLAQVALPAFLGVKKGENYRAWYNRFNRLYADFVICERDFRVVAVIELDDRSHDHLRRQDADSRKAAALGSAGIPLHRVNVNPLPDEVDLLKLLGQLPERK
jgi:hypothetical protein